ncbi:hypothetical protein F5Y13DRAFT_150518 [Hypoxylon sp. FL1857]|nr:hypothetical protein F5Y13DRAFT_150518 [Hypoxylon sp. FL1857]
MANLLSSTATSAIDEIIKKEIDSTLLKLSADEIVTMIARREDHQVIFDRLFDQLHGGNISRMLNKRKDSRILYQDLFKDVLAKMENCDQGQLQEHKDTTKSSEGGIIVNVTAATQTDAIPMIKGNGLVLITPNTPDPSSTGSRPAPNKEHNTSTRSIQHVPKIPNLNAWAALFMSHNEFCDIGPQVNILDVTGRFQRIAKGLFHFIKLLNPPYLCHRAEWLQNQVGSRGGRVLVQLDTTKDIARSRHMPHSPNRHFNDICEAFMAVRCFSLYKEYAEPSTQDIQSSLDKEVLEGDLDLDACAKFVGENIEDVSRKSKKVEWRNIIGLGGRLSSLLKDFGGESFLVLFPLYELSLHIKESLANIYPHSYPWRSLRNLLEETGLGCFFRSLSNAVGNHLLAGIKGRTFSYTDFKANLATFREDYFSKGVSHTIVDQCISHFDGEPRSSALVFCGQPSQLIHLSAESSLKPRTLLQFMDEMLGEDIVRHMIRRELPHDWTVLGSDGISQVADEKILLHDFKGIVIPLCIDKGWILFCYTNPKRSNVTHPISCINPTRSEDRFRAALASLSKLIPKHGNWIPKNVTTQSVKIVQTQVSSELDSGIHVILNAVAMASEGKHEVPPLDEKVCKALRVECFVAMLNEVHEAVAKAAKKRETDNKT